MISINEVINSDSKEKIEFSGYFYYPCFSDAFVSDKNQYHENDCIAYISKDIAELIESKDNLFGTLVGGMYAYYGMPIEIIGYIDKCSNILKFGTIESLFLVNPEGTKRIKII